MPASAASASPSPIAKTSLTRTQRIARCALLVALLIVSCFVTIPIGPVSFTLQTGVVILIALICSPLEAALACAVYVLMGTVGLPVFSGMTGGLIRASTGYLIGFIVGAGLASALRVGLRKIGVPSLGADVCTAVVYMVIADFLGAVWYAFYGGVGLLASFTAIVTPFIAVDCVKAVLAIIIAIAVRKALRWE